MKQKKAAGPQLAQFFNGPRFTLKLPNSKGVATMPATAKKPAARKNSKPTTKANRKRRGGHKHRRRNPSTALATVANPQTIVKYRTRTAAKPAVKPNRKRRRHHRRNGSTSILTRMNPFGGKGIGGLQPGDLFGGGTGILLDSTIKLFVPAGWLGIAIRLGGAIAMARFLPKSIGPAASLTAGAMVVKDSADRLFNATALFQGTVTRFIPIPATGMSGMRRVNFGNRVAAVNGGALRY